MTQELLLMADVEGLGKEGEIVKVSDGHARNHLLPRKLAALVTQAARKRLEKIRADRETRLKAELEAARAMAEKLDQASCTIAVKTGENDKIFGSVTGANIADALKAQGLEIDRHILDLPEPIKELGVFTVKAKVRPDVEASIKVWVVAE
ncbi:MAG: 50S ribosomal protein L9 [Lentisphaerae bacterium]|nr:50S ribosomal protein L9 [Lentisphaerota bacterium]